MKFCIYQRISSYFLGGIALVYYEDGQLQLESSYLDGKKVGISLLYYENGEVQARSPYVDGKLNGEFIYYRQNGEVYKIEYYRNGEQVDTYEDTED